MVLCENSLQKNVGIDMLIITVTLLILVSGIRFWLMNTMTAGRIGIVAGELTPLNQELSGVSSYAKNKQDYAEYLPLEQGVETGLADLEAIICRQLNGQLVRQETDYRHFTVRSTPFQLITDIELLVDREIRKVNIKIESRVLSRRFQSSRQLYQQIKRAYPSQDQGQQKGIEE